MAINPPHGERNISWGNKESSMLLSLLHVMGLMPKKNDHHPAIIISGIIIKFEGTDVWTSFENMLYLNS